MRVQYRVSTLKNQTDSTEQRHWNLFLLFFYQCKTHVDAFLEISQIFFSSGCYRKC
ncbi:hypothetical protein HanIR_Chr05g0235221 [Helianthus annuus]|nr:hypothetical protein HanIR_Chr05g0235221 [Helianthus annuus]